MVEEHPRATLTTVSEERRAQAMERFAVLRPHIEDHVPLTRAARDAGVPRRTAERWLAIIVGTGLRVWHDQFGATLGSVARVPSLSL